MGSKRVGKIVPKDLSKYPNKGTDPLTQTERDAITNMSVSDALELAYAMIGEGTAALATQSNEHNTAAHAVGFENAEHETLAFLASDWFDIVVDAICAGSGTPTARTPDEYAQDILDRAFGGDVVVVRCDDGPLLRRTWDLPIGHKYSPSLARTVAPGTYLLSSYNAILELEQFNLERIVLVLPIEWPIQAMEETYHEEVCCA